MSSDPQFDRGEPDREVERLSEQFKDQVRLARERIADRYGKLIEGRSFDPADKPKP